MAWTPNKQAWKPRKSMINSSNPPTFVGTRDMRPAAVQPNTFAGGAISNFKATIPNYKAFPLTPKKGDVVYRSDLDRYYMWDGITWIQITIGTLDDVKDGVTYGKVVQTALTVNQPDVSKVGIINKTLDNITDTATYARIQTGDTTTNRIDFSKALLNKQLDNIPDGTTYARIKSTALTTGDIASGYITTARLASGAATEVTPTVNSTNPVNITPYDTDVSVIAGTATVNGTADTIHLSGFVQMTVTNVQSNDQAYAKVFRGVTQLSTVDIKLTLSTATVVGGDAVAFVEFYDTGVSGSQTYTVKLNVHNGSANGTFAVSKTYAFLNVSDYRAQ